MIIQANGTQRKMRVAILISDKLDFKIKKVRKNTEGHFIMIKGILHQEDMTLINIYAPNQGTLKYGKQLLTTKGRNRPKHCRSMGPKYTTVGYGWII